MNHGESNYTREQYEIPPGCNCCTHGIFPIRKNGINQTIDNSCNEFVATQKNMIWNNRIILAEPGQYVIVYTLNVRTYKEDSDVCIYWMCNELLLEDTITPIEFYDKRSHKIVKRFWISCRDEKKELSFHYYMKERCNMEFTGNVLVMNT